MQTLKRLKYVILIAMTAITISFLLPSKPAQAQVDIYSDMCCTKKFWCRLDEGQRVGSKCYCNTNYGPILGYVCYQ